MFASRRTLPSHRAGKPEWDHPNQTGFLAWKLSIQEQTVFKAETKTSRGWEVFVSCLSFLNYTYLKSPNRKGRNTKTNKMVARFKILVFIIVIILGQEKVSTPTTNLAD